MVNAVKKQSMVSPEPYRNLIARSLLRWGDEEEEKKWKIIDKHEIRWWRQRFHEQNRAMPKPMAFSLSFSLHTHTLHMSFRMNNFHCVLYALWVCVCLVQCTRIEINIFEIYSCRRRKSAWLIAAAAVAAAAVAVAAQWNVATWKSWIARIVADDTPKMCTKWHKYDINCTSVWLNGVRGLHYNRQADETMCDTKARKRARAHTHTVTRVYNVLRRTYRI